jgi:amidase
VAGPAPGEPYTAPPPLRPFVDELIDDARGLRVGWTATVPNAVVACDPEVAAVVGQTAAMLGELGHHVEEAVPDWDDPTFTERFIDAFGVWTAADLDAMAELAGRPVGEDGVEPATWAIAELGRTVTGVRYLAAIDALHGYGRRLAPFWERYDLLACPVVPEPAPLLGSFDGGPDNPLHGLFRSAEVVPFTTPFNATGQPAISVPFGTTSEGLPVGVQLVAPAGRDDLCLRVAAQLERARPWEGRRPALP